MAVKKTKNATPPKNKIGKAPSLAERITDFSGGRMSNIKVVKPTTNKK